MAESYKTFDADIVVASTGLKTYTADVSIDDANVFKTFDTDIIVASIGSKTYTADVDITLGFFSTFTADASIAETGLTKTYVADVSMADAGLTKTYSADTSVAETGLTKTYTADVDITLRFFSTFTADVAIEVLSSDISFPVQRPVAYDADAVWDEKTQSWYASGSEVGSERMAQGGGRLYNRLIVINDQGDIYYGAT